MLGKYQIDKDVPIPVRHSAYPGRKPLYPFAELAVGDSFFVPCPPERKPSKLGTIIASAANSWRNRKGLEFTFKYRVEVREENGVIGVRFWRMKDAVQ